MKKILLYLLNLLKINQPATNNSTQFDSFDFFIDDEEQIHVIVSDTSKLIIKKIEFTNNQQNVICDYDIVGDVTDSERIAQQFITQLLVLGNSKNDKL